MNLQKFLTPLAKRFVAGETAADAVAAALKMNESGVLGILDFLGEHVSTAEEVHAAVDEYLRLLQAIHEVGARASISLKASQTGLTLSPEMCLENLKRIAEKAGDLGLFVWIDMEGSALTERTVGVFDRLRQRFPNTGLCLQAYLRRTEKDLDRLMRGPVHIRLCKGAYKEPRTIAYADKAEVNLNYRVLAKKLLDRATNGAHPAFATHDLLLIQDLLTAVQARGVKPENYEFQMLYGIQNEHLQNLAQQGHSCHVYIPYGTAWLPYFLRRLRERKENIYFLIKNTFRL